MIRSSAADRRRAVEIRDGDAVAGARAARVAERMVISLQRWRRQFASDGNDVDSRKGRVCNMVHRLSHQERQGILALCKEPPYASLAPAQIEPDLDDQGEFLASESCFYRVLHAQQKVQRRARTILAQEPRPMPQWPPM